MSETAVVAIVSSGFVASIVVLGIVLEVFDKRSERKRAQQVLNRRPITYTWIDAHDEWEVETADGRRFRSSEHGIIWHSFPDGNPTEAEYEDELEDGLNRHKRLEKWTKS